jgi:hypothetical protein
MQLETRGLRACLMAALAALALHACGQILNTEGIEIVRVPEDAGSGGGGGSTGLAPCDLGEFRCQGAALQLCEDPGTFRTVRVCSSERLCCASPELCAGQPGCLAPACSEGERRCRGDVLEACNELQTGFVEIDRCPSALHCNASLGRCTDQPCNSAAREFQCSGSSLEECLPDRDQWTLAESCVTNGLCSAIAPAGCAQQGCRIGGTGSLPSPYQCVSGNLMRCNDDQTDWEFVETCLNTANCNALIEPLMGDPRAAAMTTDQLSKLGCSPPDCAPGRYRCVGNQLFLCGVNRTGYLELSAVCESARQCDANLGRCLDQPCIEGQRQCSGDEYQECTAGGWRLLELCASGAPCDPQNGCQPAVCQPNEYRCDGVELLRCNVERTGWIPVKTCDSAALCDVDAKRCDTPACLPGARRCGAFGQLEGCRGDLAGWELLLDCAVRAGVPRGPNASSLCDPSGDGQCLPTQTCNNAALRCNGAELEQCRDNAWRPYARCETAAQCNLSREQPCLEPVCQPGSFRCVGPGNPPVPAAPETPRQGLALEVCNPAGTGFDAVRQCATLEVCDDAHGQCDICDAARPITCAGNNLRVCTADGQENTLYKACAQGCVETVTGGVSRTTCLEDLDNTTSN